MDEQERQKLVDETVKQTVDSLKEEGVLEPIRKFTPGGEEKETKDKEGKVTVISEPEDRVIADRKGGFGSFAEFCAALSGKGLKHYGSETPPKLKLYERAINKTAGYMEEGDMSQGGYLVPEEFRATLLQTSLENSIVRSRATEIPMSSNRVVLPALVDADHSSNYFGGISVYRTNERAQQTVSNPTFARIALTLHNLTGLAYVTDELMEDSPISIEPILNFTFGQAISFVEDDDYLNGTGASMAIGAFHANNPSIVSVSGETGQVASTIVAENIFKMWARLYPGCHAKSVWIANIVAFPQLATMSIAVGTGGIPVYIPANGLSQAPFGTLMGRPLILSEKMQVLGSAGVIGLADFSHYLIGSKVGGGLKTASSIHLRFDYNETAFRFNMRYDGQPWWTSALTPKRGDTLSPFVRLAAVT